MAGVVAMASVIEDFDTQPCKKACKDVDSPVVKTITNYFSPVAKPAEKPFSPPRSNNIMDYFNRKGPSPKNHALSPSQAKENCQTGKQITPPAMPKQPGQKRSRKASKTARKLVETTEDSSCIVIEETDEVAATCGVLGSDTAVLLGQICFETSASGVTSDDKRVESDQHQKASLGKSNQLNSIELSPILPPKDKPKKAKTPTGKSKKRKKLEDELPEAEVQEMSLGDVSMEVNVGDASQLNNTVTISFEDFVRSQDIPNNELCEEPESVAVDDQLQITSADGNQQSEPCLQVSPRLVTVQAEVHTISPKEKVKSAGKVASIFNKEKVSSSVHVASTQTESSLQTASKWKSNVVLQEEDIELCVLESSSTPKCSQAERQLFMAAFKQPSLDGSKIKSCKSQGKPKPNGDEAADATDQVREEHPENQSITVPEKGTVVSLDDKEVKKKPTRKRQKKATDKLDTTSAPAAAPGENAEIIDVDIDNKKENEPAASTPSVPVVRRSRRAAVARQTSTITVAESPPKSSSKHGSAEVSPAKKRKSKHGVFKAEMVCPADETQSPIRIRFRRVGNCRNREDHTASTPLATKNTKDSKKTKQAKKLLEKAKAMKQSKKVSTEDKTLRRSSRTEASVKRSYCDDEDSIICVDDNQKNTLVPEKSKSKKALRSLNDVLGKAAPIKEAAPGSKVCQDKVPRKPTPVSVFDDSSRDGSENSQDDEQFKARKEFLKSGLPESFKKQMVKTATAKEANATACSSSQPVVHISQAPNDCLFWKLPWPQSAFVNHLKEIQFQFSYICVESNELLKLKTQPVYRVSSEQVSSWRPAISANVREELLKELSGSNPAFPVQKFMSHFLKKRADHTQQCAASEPSPVPKGSSPELSTGGKRKRAEDEGETVKVAKKQRSRRSGENLSTPPAEGAPAKKEGRPRRGVKSVSTEDGMKSEPSQTAARVQSEDKAVIVLDDSPGPKTVKPDVMTEDTLWTEKYQPQHSSEVIGNTASVRRLHSWLKEWKLRADKEDKKKQKDQKRDEGSVDSDWECEEEESRDAEDTLCNTMIITGPTGIGKTAAVYACAQELGFKVFEVNSSSQRSGRLILSQLKEATQSHQVDSGGVNAHKPTYFNSYSTSSSAGRPGSSPRQVNSPRRAVSSPRKLPQSPRGVKKGGLAPTALANFFKMSKPTNKEKEQTAVSKKKPIEVDSKKTLIKSPPNAFTKDCNPDELSKKTATSLILFEEVDVIFDDDLGFLSAIKTFMTTTKRPVILTTSDPAFSAMFDGDFEEIMFETPSVVDVASYLQLLCLAEDTRTDLKDVSALLSLNSCDVRKTLLQLQFWTRSGGGRQHLAPPAEEEKAEGAVAVLANCEMEDPAPLPFCDTGCTESMLGLLSVAPQQNIWELLKKREEDCSKVVTMSRRQGVDLLYANMEALLPLPVTTLTMVNRKQQRPLPLAPDQPSENPAQSQELPSHAKLLHAQYDFSDDPSPVKVSNRMKKNRRRRCPPEQGPLQSDSDSEDGFLSIKQQSSQVQKNVTLMPMKVMKKPLSRGELVKSVPVLQCLRSLADFMDDMSFVDLLGNEECNIKDLSGAAVVKDGLTDEARIDTERRRSGPLPECASEISAQVQSLGFSKCCSSVSEAWLKVQQLDAELSEEAERELTLPVASHNEGCTFTQQGLCHPQVVKQRRAVMDDLEVKGVFGPMWNRPAAAQDYLPALRTICKSEHLKEQGKVKRRFLHYLDAIHLGLKKATLERLSEDFP